MQRNRLFSDYLTYSTQLKEMLEVNQTSVNCKPTMYLRATAISFQCSLLF